METSDSEYFESADELISEDELDEKNNVKLDELTLKDNIVDSMPETLENKTETKIQNVTATVKKEEASKADEIKKVPDSNANQITKQKIQCVDRLSDICKAKAKEDKSKDTRVKDISECDNNKTLTCYNQLTTDESSTSCIKDLVPKSDISNTSTDKCDKTLEISSTENMWEDDKWDNLHEENANTNDNMWNNDEWNAINTPTKQSDTKQRETNKQESDFSNWDDEWEPLDTDTTKTKPQTGTDSWSSWGNWGISSVLSTATSITSQVTQGISSVIETGIGVPNPEDLARIHREEKENPVPEEEISEDDNKNNKSVGFGFGNLVSGVTHITKLVEQTGSKVINGGLDTLETIGKKTVEILQENDPGLKGKTAFLKMDQNKPILSQVLREAKEKSDQENKIMEQKSSIKKANYESLFDDHQGLVHLEALEMLSKQCKIKLENVMQTYVGDQLSEMEETIEQVKELCELPEDDDDDDEISIFDLESKLINAVTEMNIKITYDKLIRTWKDTEEWLDKINLNVCDENDIHQQAIETLAQLTAIVVEQYHKAGELLLIKEHRSTADEADSLVQLTTILTSFMQTVSTRFNDKLTCIALQKYKKESVDSLITNVFFEAANSSSYIKDAFALLVPVLLIGAV